MGSLSIVGPRPMIYDNSIFFYRKLFLQSIKRGTKCARVPKNELREGHVIPIFSNERLNLTELMAPHNYYPFKHETETKLKYLC